MFIMFKAKDWSDISKKYAEDATAIEQKFDDLQTQFVSKDIRDIMLELGAIKSI